MLDLQTIARLDQPDQTAPRARRRPIQREGLSRRAVLRNTVIGAGLLISLKASDLFTPGEAGAAHVGTPGYRIHSNCQYTGDFYKELPGGCDRPCGWSTIWPDACVTNAYDHYVGYHKTSSPYSLRPAQCTTHMVTDGWKWQASDNCVWCCFVFRCHDGWKNTSSGPVPTVCAYAVDCASCP